MQNEVSYIILNYNGSEHILKCLESIYIQDSNKDDIIVVDNNSKDGSLEIIQKKYPEVKTICNKRNTGYASANNSGIKKSLYENIILLNFDIILKKDFTSKLLKKLKSSGPETGGIIPLLIYHDNKDIINSGGVLLYRDFFSFNRWAGQNITNVDINNTIIRGFLGFYGAAVLLRKKMIIDTGFFDESFFLYQEETNLCLKAFNKGWTFAFEPESKAYHFHSVSLGEKSLKKIFYCERNRFFNLIIFGSVKDIFFSFYHTILRLKKQNKKEMLHHFSGHKINIFYKILIIFTIFAGLLCSLFYLDILLYKRKKYRKKNIF